MRLWSINIFSSSLHTGYVFTAIKRDAEADTPIAAAGAAAVGVDDEIFDGALFDVEAVVVEHDLLDVPLVEGAVDLRAGSLDCRSFSAIQDLGQIIHGATSSVLD